MNHEDYLASSLSLADHASQGNLSREMARRKIIFALICSGISWDCVTYEGDTFLIVLKMGLFRYMLETLKLLVRGQTWKLKCLKLIKPCLKQKGAVIVMNSPSNKKFLKVCLKMINQAKQPKV